MRLQLLGLGALWLALAALIIVTQVLPPASITVQWRTETEVNSAGFNIYRAPSPNGPYTRLNERLIPSRGSAAAGATYEYLDDMVTPGAVYYYRLEDVELDNSSAQHEPVEERAPLPPWWAPIIAALSAGAGLFLWWRAFRQRHVANARAS